MAGFEVGNGMKLYDKHWSSRVIIPEEYEYESDYKSLFDKAELHLKMDYSLDFGRISNMISAELYKDKLGLLVDVINIKRIGFDLDEIHDTANVIENIWVNAALELQR